MAAFSDGSYYEGYQSISKRAPTTNSFSNGGVGGWRWCLDTCGYTGDIGMVGTFTTTSSSYLAVGFYDSAFSTVKLTSFDSDGRLGTESGGRTTFLGNGLWYFYSGGQADIGFAMSRIGTTPVVVLSTTLAMETPAAQIASVTPTPEATTLSAKNADALAQKALERLNASTVR